MTPLGRKTFDFIKSYVAEHGVSPNYREIGQHIGANVSGVHRVVHALKREGLITVLRDKARGIRIMPPGYTVQFRPEVDNALNDLARKQGQTPETLIKSAVAAYVVGEAR